MHSTPRATCSKTSIRAFLLVVGIAGGVPSYEFTLGDVDCLHAHRRLQRRGGAEGSRAWYALGGGPLHLR